MKKVFAFISVFALAIAMVGLAPKHVSAAETKWTKDPTLGENEIPLYIMDSIYSTFPFEYDNVAKPDDNWQGAARMYPWNETRLQVKQIGEDGEFTGKEYAIFFTGNLSMKEPGQGNNILFYNVVDGQPVLQRSNGGRLVEKNGVPMDPSLSHMRTNLADEDITFDAIKLWSDNGSGNGSNLYNRMFVFDGEGRMVRGAGLNELFEKAVTGAEATEVDENRVTPQFCYVDGKVTPMGDGVVCDKKKVPAVDENGDPVVDPETGEEVLVESDEDDILYERYIWQYVSPEEFASEEFCGVNEVGYLHDGWDAQKWDYAFDDADVEGGKVCIAFVGSEGSNYKLNAAQLEVYAETVKAQNAELDDEHKIPEPTADTTRTMARMITVPAHGRTFDFGYLDRGVLSGKIKFMQMFNQGFAHGRKLDAEGKGMSYAKAYNHSVKPLYTQDAVVNGSSFQFKEGQNVIEVMQGDKIIPSKNLVYTGMSRYFANEYDLTSFQADPSALDLYITNGNQTVVEPSQGYTDFDVLVSDFISDIAEWKGVPVEEIKVDTAANFKSNFSWGEFFATNEANANKPDYGVADYGHPSFWNIPENREKWGFLLEKIEQTMLKYPGGDVYDGSLAHVHNAATKFYCGSPDTIGHAIWAFLYGQDHGYFGFSFSGGHNTEWMDTRSNVEKWDQYTIDTTTDPINTNYNLTFRAVNRNTHKENSISITYVVVDSYTPILEINHDNLFLDAEGAINPHTWASAWDATYNGSIKGNVISDQINYTSDTLDFAVDANYQQGKHRVTAEVRNGNKVVTKSFVVEITDNHEPVVDTQQVIINYGEHFDPIMAITYAMDNVDGNLLDCTTRAWYSVEGKYSTTPAASDFYKNGKPSNKDYDLTLVVTDTAGNETEADFRLTIVRPTSLDTDSAVEALKDDVNALSEQLQALNEQVESLKAQIDSLVAKANAKCGSKSSLMVEFLAATGLLVVLLRRKH